MAAQSISESVVTGIIDLIKANIPAALAEIRSDREDARVTTEPPVSYFIYEKAAGYKTPAIFVIADSVDFRLDRGPNSINAEVRLIVSCLVEDKIAENLTYKTYRYSDALHKVLDRAHIKQDQEKRLSVVKVQRIDYSLTQQTKTSQESVFRKEVMLTCQVEHYEGEN
jgi:hypothetical protein